MSEAGQAGKVPPDELVLRAHPRPVTRFSRKLLIGVAAIGSALVFGTTLIALNPPSFRSKGQGKELYNIDRKPTADGLSVLPRTYGEMNKSVPQLGPPMAGDLGPPTVRAEREAGIASPQGNERLAFRPNSEDDAERAERLRLARQAQQARKPACSSGFRSSRMRPWTERLKRLVRPCQLMTSCGASTSIQSATRIISSASWTS